MKENAAFCAVIVIELVVIALFVLDKRGDIGLGFLWLNVVGALDVAALAAVLEWVLPKQPAN